MKNVFICLFLPAFIHAQKPLSIGNTIPVPQLQYLKTHSLLGAGGIIILDFFATWCTSCVRELPKLDSLQKRFGEQFRVILITSQSKEAIDAFRKKSKTFASVSFPVITEDSVFKNLFPNRSIPHEVWINEEGKILAITDPVPVNADNIQSFLSGKNLSLPVKIDALDFDYKKPLLQDGNGGSQDYLFYQTKFTAWLPGMGAS